MVYIGNHGLSWWRQGREETLAEAVPYETMVRQAKKDLAVRLDLPGLLLEDKGPILALHYRRCADPKPVKPVVQPPAIPLTPSTKAPPWPTSWRPIA